VTIIAEGPDKIKRKPKKGKKTKEPKVVEEPFDAGIYSTKNSVVFVCLYLFCSFLFLLLLPVKHLLFACCKYHTLFKKECILQIIYQAHFSIFWFRPGSHVELKQH